MTLLHKANYNQGKTGQERCIMDATLGVLADYANISQEGKLNIMGIFQEINPPVLPFTLPMMFLVLNFEASAAEFDTDKAIKVALLNADGKQLIGLEQTLRVPQSKRPGSRAYMSAVLGFAGAKFEQAGDYAFSILVGGEEKRNIPLHVNEPIKGGS